MLQAETPPNPIGSRKQGFGEGLYASQAHLYCAFSDRPHAFSSSPARVFFPLSWHHKLASGL